MVQRERPTQEGWGKFDVDALTFLTAKIDAMTQQLDRLNVTVANVRATSPTLIVVVPLII